MIDKADAIRRTIMEAAGFTGMDALARPWLGGVGAILMLHRVTASPRRPGGPNRHLTVSPAFLSDVIVAMQNDGFRFVSMDEAVQRLRAGDTGELFAAITADDGYRDNIAEALPVLERHDAPITVFIAPALIDGTVPLWWDAVEAVAAAGRTIKLRSGEEVECAAGPSRDKAFQRLRTVLTQDVEETEQGATLREWAEQAGTDPFQPGRETLMTWDEVRRLARHPLATIAAHTVRHFNLRRLSSEAASAEIQESGERLAVELGSGPKHFAYPYGDAGAAGPREAALVRDAGFTSAVTTRHGVLREGHLDHLHALPRISLNGRFQNLDHVRVMTRGLTTPLANRGRRLVKV